MDEPHRRLAPLPRGRWDDDMRSALGRAFPDATVERFLSTGADAIRLPDAITTMMHHPELAGRWLAFNNVLLLSPTIDDRVRELIVLRVAWRTRANYEWVQHVQLARRYGITPDEIDAVAHGGEAEWSELEAAVLAATDQLIDAYRVEDDTWKVLAEHLDERQLVEVVFVVGAYTTLAMAFKSFGLQLEPEMDASIELPEPLTDYRDDGDCGTRSG